MEVVENGKAVSVVSSLSGIRGVSKLSRSHGICCSKVGLNAIHVFVRIG